MNLKETVKIWKNKNVIISYIARSVIRFSTRKDSFKVINLHIHPSILLNENAALDALWRPKRIQIQSLSYFCDEN